MTTVWERPGAAVGSLPPDGGLGIAAIRTGATRVVGAFARGLVTYLALQGCVLAGLGTPFAFVRREGTER